MFYSFCTPKVMWTPRSCQFEIPEMGPPPPTSDLARDTD